MVDGLVAAWRAESARGGSPQPHVGQLLACRGVSWVGGGAGHHSGLEILCEAAIEAEADGGGNPFRRFLEASPEINEQVQWYRDQPEATANRTLAARCLVAVRPVLGVDADEVVAPAIDLAGGSALRRG